MDKLLLVVVRTTVVGKMINHQKTQPQAVKLGRNPLSWPYSVAHNNDFYDQPIESYGIVSDLNTVALVGLNGSVDFMCLPDLDSPKV
jgi:hypothetical protein